jgi:cytochrome b561
MTSVMSGSGIAGGEKYSGFAMLLHWVIAICILTMIPIGIVMGTLQPGNVQNGLYVTHRSFGVLVLALMLVRLVYRLAHGVPAPEPTLTAWQRVVSHITHLALYALVIAQALIGWAATSAYGASISVFSLFTLPAILAKDEAISKPLFAAHDLLGFTIAGLVALHVGAALYHFLIRGDGVMQRMVP